MLPAKDYSSSPGSASELSYSQDAWLLWGARIGYVAAVLILLFLSYSCAQTMRNDNYFLLLKTVGYVVLIFVAMISGRDTVYKIDVNGDRLLLQTAFSKKEYRLSELKDVYKKGDIQGSFIWIIQTVDCNYKFQAKKEAARKALDWLLSRISSPMSNSWTEYSMSELTERRYIGIAILMLLCGIIAFAVGHSATFTIVFFICSLVALTSMTRIVRRLKVNPDGLMIVNLLSQEKVIPWQSIMSIKRTKIGGIFVSTSQGKFVLSAIDGSNIWLQKTARNVTPNFFIDELNPVPKLNQNKR